MAKSLYLPLLLMLSLLLAHRSTASSHHHHTKHLKSLHFSLFQHKTVNKTGFVIVSGVAGPAVSETTAPFGTIFVFDDKLTTTPDASSYVAGIAEGSSITSSFDGLRSISLAKITLKIKGYEGSISILGGTHNTKPSDDPVVGGTGDFMFVQGYVTSSPVDRKTPIFCCLCMNSSSECLVAQKIEVMPSKRDLMPQNARRLY